jgi:acyl carrier protein
LLAVLRGLVGGVAVRRVEAAVGVGSLRERLVGVGEQERGRLLLELVRGAAAVVLGHADAGLVEADRGLLDVGFDSLTAVELRNRLGKETGLRLPVTLLFDYPTPARIAGYLREQLLPDETALVANRLEAIGNELNLLASTDGALRSQVTNRLRQLLAEMESASANGTNGNGAVAHLESASDDEIFDFIDKELGI